MYVGSLAQSDASAFRIVMRSIIQLVAPAAGASASAPVVGVFAVVPTKGDELEDSASRASGSLPRPK